MQQQQGDPGQAKIGSSFFAASNLKCFQQSHFQSVLLRLLEDIVKPDLSAYKHARLTEQGTQRIRPRLPDNVQQEVDPPAETINILEWVSERLEVNSVGCREITGIESDRPIKSAFDPSSHPNTS